MFFKRSKKTINPRRQEAVVLIFFAVSFFIYGMASLQFYLYPKTDPMLIKSVDSSPATVVLAGLFFLYGIYSIYMRRSIAGKLLGITIALESAVAASWKIFFANASAQVVRLSGTIEGFICCAILMGLLVAVWRGASVWR